MSQTHQFRACRTPEAPAALPGVAAAPGSQPASSHAGDLLERLPYWPIAGMIIVLGAVIRIRQWVFGRSFWSDELYVAHNLRDRDYLDLLEPLAFSQSAPPGWLWLERLSLHLFGTSEQSLRLVPLLFSLALLPVVGYFGRRLMPPSAAIAALLLVAVAPFLVAYSNELKQYSAEAFCVTLLVGMALLLTRDALTWRRGIVFWSVSVVASLLSMLAIPVAGALGALIGAHALSRPGLSWPSRWRELGRFLLLAPVWIVAAVWMYVAILAPGTDDPQLKAYWQGKAIYPYRPLIDVPATLDWFATTTRSLAVMPFAAWSALIAVPLLVIGAVLCRRQVNAVAVFILLAPLAVGLVGGAVSVYPFTGRLALYTVPASLMLASFAVGPPHPRHVDAGRVRRSVGVALVVALAIPQLATDVTATVHPERAYPQGAGANVADYRGALGYLSAERRPGDVILATPVAWNAQSYYGPSVDGYVVPSGPAGCPKRNVSALLAGRPRVWLVQVTHWDDIENRDLVVRLGAGGAVAERTFHGTRIVRIDLAGNSAVGADICLIDPPNGAAVR